MFFFTHSHMSEVPVWTVVPQLVPQAKYKMAWLLFQSVIDPDQAAALIKKKVFLDGTKPVSKQLTFLGLQRFTVANCNDVRCIFYLLGKDSFTAQTILRALHKGTAVPDCTLGACTALHPTATMELLWGTRPAVARPAAAEADLLATPVEHMNKRQCVQALSALRARLPTVQKDASTDTCDLYSCLYTLVKKKQALQKQLLSDLLTVARAVDLDEAEEVCMSRATLRVADECALWVGEQVRERFLDLWEYTVSAVSASEHSKYNGQLKAQCNDEAVITAYWRSRPGFPQAEGKHYIRELEAGRTSIAQFEEWSYLRDLEIA